MNDFFREAAEANARIAGFKDGLAGPKKALRALNKLEKTSRLDDAQRRQRDDLQALVNVAPPPAPHHGLKVGLGIGKTSAGIKGLAPLHCSERDGRRVQGTMDHADSGAGGSDGL